jgi:hypothetical protein
MTGYKVHSGTDFIKEHLGGGSNAAAEETIGEDENGNQQPTRPIRFKLTPFEQIQIDTAPDYVVKGIIPKAGLVIIWGAPKCGKSFLAFDLAMHITLGLEYRGRRVQAGPVVYLALEGGRGFNKRVEAWRRHHGDDLDGRESPPFYLLNIPVNVIADYRALIADIRAQTPTAPTVIFIDTLNRALGAHKEDDEGMRMMIQAADALRAAFDCAVVIIHHCGIEGTRPRGHTSLTGADDVQIAVTKDKNGLITATVEHMKDGEPAPPFSCHLKLMDDLGIDDDGDPITSCVITPAQSTPSASPRASKLTGSQARFLDILVEATIDAPEAHKTKAGIPCGRTAISREWLKTCCKSKGWFDPAATENNNRAKVSNMINALAGKRLIGVNTLYIWDAR